MCFKGASPCPMADMAHEAAKGRMYATNEFILLQKKVESGQLVEVVHGEWLLRHEGCGHYWECSVCHENPCIYVTKHTKFCPNCGAKMDGGTE